MPILMTSDTRRALLPGATKCESRSLRQSRFVFFDASLVDDKRLALYQIATHGSRDLQNYRGAQQKNIDSQDRYLQRNDLTPAQRNRAQEKIAEANRILGQITHLPGWQGAGLHPANTSWLDSIPSERKRLIKLTTASRLIIGMANGVLENAGLTLHRFLGIPCIPGSASKGRSRDACDLLPDQQAMKLHLFGNDHSEKKQFQQGSVCFLPAYPTNKEAVLELDILTPHYPKYYTGKGNGNADDTEGPNPQVFLTVAAGVEFLFPLVVIDQRLASDEIKARLDSAEACLRHALITIGIGAKTSAGYGYFVDPNKPLVVGRVHDDLGFLPKLSPAETFIKEWQGKVNAMAMSRFLPRLAELVGGDAVLEAEIVGKLVPPDQRKAFANPVTNAKGFDLLKRLNLLPPRNP